MSNTAISVENLSKSYRLGVISTGTFYGDLKRWWARQRGYSDPYQKLDEMDHGNRDGDTLWALDDVNFTVNQGETLGIIGRNGAGKSTLLKILSRVTAPTSGAVRIKGRIASLLEVGTGFHPELTGRENIYLNGAIMGMSKAEVGRKFDEIVDFSGVEKFIDTPVKRYSSGMYVRLAFAVAAHLEPDILLVDEVLAVGDVAFQKKCLGKMSDITSGEGRTILIVSHQMPMIQRLATRCLLFDRGQITEVGTPSEAISQYLNLAQESLVEWQPVASNQGDKAAPYFKLSRFALVDEHGNLLPKSIETTKPVYVLFEGQAEQVDKRLNIGFNLIDSFGNMLFMGYHTDQPEENWPDFSTGDVKIRARLDLSMLNESDYKLEFVCGLHTIKMFYAQGTSDISLSFHVPGNYHVSPYWVKRRDTILSPLLQWETLV